MFYWRKQKITIVANINLLLYENVVKITGISKYKKRTVKEALFYHLTHTLTQALTGLIKTNLNVKSGSCES